MQRAYRTELSRTKAAILQLGDRSVDLHDALVTLPDGTTLALTATERTLLRKLAENRGHIVTYDALCEAVWGADYYGYENSLGFISGICGKSWNRSRAGRAFCRR